MLRHQIIAGTVFLLLAAVTARVRAEEAAPCQAIVSVAEQKIVVVRDGGLVAKFPVSTSRFGVGDSHGSYFTPLGRLRVCEKLGDHLPQGAVIKHRRATGEVLAPNAPGRDPIVTRILWLDGLEAQNSNAKERSIYIHGTPEERLIGRKASYGCIRMRSKDVVALYEELGVGSTVSIITEKLPRLAKYVPKPPEPVMVAKITPPAPTPAPAPKVVAVAAPPKPTPEPIAAKPVPTPAPKLAEAAKAAPKIAEAAKPTPAPKAEKPAVVASAKPEPAKAPVAKLSPTPAPARVAEKAVEPAAAPTRVAAAKKPSETPAPEPSRVAAVRVKEPVEKEKKQKEAMHLAAVTVDPDRLAFLRSHEASLAASRPAPASSEREAGGTQDLSERMKGSILDSGLSGRVH